MTQSEFDDYLSLVHPMMSWEKGNDIMSDLAKRKIDWEMSLRHAFGDGTEQVDDGDELG